MNGCFGEGVSGMWEGSDTTKSLERAEEVYGGQSTLPYWHRQGTKYQRVTAAVQSRQLARSRRHCRVQKQSINAALPLQQRPTGPEESTDAAGLEAQTVSRTAHVTSWDKSKSHTEHEHRCGASFCHTCTVFRRKGLALWSRARFARLLLAVVFV